MALWKLRKSWYFSDPSKGKSGKTKASSLPGELCSLCRHFSLDEIKTATHNFDKELIIGRGGFGNVYKGLVDEGTMTVAIKRLSPGSAQGRHEFNTETLLLCQLRHVHLVSLIGLCTDEGEMILVYDYTTNGTLRDHLHDTDNTPLLWKQRLEICVGAARGLHYLHTGLKHPVIHRDVKTSNILLDEKWVAKVSDFGLSKQIPNNTTASYIVEGTRGTLDLDNIAKVSDFGLFKEYLDRTGVSTRVMGTFGYLDPDYARCQQLTEKSDVYSFGVVLFEVLCARKAVNPQLEEKEQWQLANWARKCIEKGTIGEIIDLNLKGKIAPACFKVYVEVAESCVRNQRIQRPTMIDVMEKLDLALELQANADAMKEKMSPGGEHSYPKVLSFPVDGTTR